MTDGKRAYVVVGVAYEYNDEYHYTAENDAGFPYCVFLDPAAAEAERGRREVAAWRSAFAPVCYGEGPFTYLGDGGEYAFDPEVGDWERMAERVNAIFGTGYATANGRYDGGDLCEFRVLESHTDEQVRALTKLMPGLRFYKVEEVPLLERPTL